MTAAASPALRGLLLGARLGLERLRERRTVSAILLAVALALAEAVIERDAGSLGAVDRSLAGTFRLIIPLLTWAFVTRAATRHGLSAGAFPLARYGVPRSAVALGVAASAALIAAAAGAVLAALTVLAAHTPSAPPLAGDLLLSAWIGAVTSLAYAGWVAFGSTFFRGRGAWAPVLIDFLIGGSTGLAAALLPRAHATSLLGLGSGPLSMPPPASFGALFAMAIGLLLLAAARAER